MTLPSPRRVIIPYNQLTDGTNLNDVLSWNGTAWISAVGQMPDTSVGQILKYNGTRWRCSSSVQNITFTETINATLTVANNKTLTYNNSITINGTDGTTMTFPSSNKTMLGESDYQILTNKTFTHPIITPQPTITPATGMIYFDSTENLLSFYNSMFWYFVGMYKSIPVYIPELESSSNNGIFYYIPVITAIGDLGAVSTTKNREFPKNGWNSNTEWEISSGNASITPSETYPTIDMFLEYNFGIQTAGIYSIIFTPLMRSHCGIITVTEATTNTLICELDMFRTDTAASPSQMEFPFIFSGVNGAPASLIIRWTCTKKNTAATNYNMRFANYIQLSKLG